MCEYCVTPVRTLSFWERMKRSLFAMFLLTDTPKAQASSDSLDHEEINQKAAALLDTYGDHILRCAYSYLHNLSDAEEIVQDTLIQYLRTAPVFQNAEHEKAWLLRVAINLSKNKLQYNRLRETDELKETLELQQREDLSFVWEAVKQLPEQQREVIHLYYYEGYPISEIGSLLSRNESTVRSDLRRGRIHLRRVLKEEYDFE